MPRFPVHRALALVLAGLALAAFAPGLLAAGESAEAERAERPAPAIETEAPGLYAVDAALAVDVAGVRVERGVDRSMQDPGTTLAPDHRAEVDLAEVAPVEAPVDLDLALGAGRSVGERKTTPLAAAVAAAGPAAAFATPVVAVATGVGLAALAALAWLWPQVKKVAAVVLYAHIGRAQVFENEVRERVFGIIRAEPGIHASDIAAKAAVSWGTALYHLDVLEQNAMVVVHKDGRYRRYFANGAAGSKQATSVLRNERTATVHRLLTERPGLAQRELAEAASMSPQALHWHLVRLEQGGLLRKEREGRLVRHYAAG